MRVGFGPRWSLVQFSASAGLEAFANRGQLERVRVGAVARTPAAFVQRQEPGPRSHRACQVYGPAAVFNLGSLLSRASIQHSLGHNLPIIHQLDESEGTHQHEWRKKRPELHLAA